MKNKYGWKVGSIGGECELYQPKTISQQEMNESGAYNVYGANGIIGKFDKYNHEFSELLMTCRGATCGTMNVSKPYSWINGNAMVIHPKQIDKIELQFLHYQLRAIDLKDVITGAAQPQITRQSLTGLQIVIPPISTQQQIVYELDVLRDIITKRKQQLEELDKLAQATFYDMFGDPVSNEKGWEMKKLKQICTKLNDGTHFSPISTKEGDFKYITAKNIKKNGFDFSNLTYISEKDHREIFSRCNPEYGDILYIKDGATTGIAQINTLKEEFSLLSSVALLKYDRALVHGYYLRDMLNNESVYKFIRSNMGGVAITRLTIQKINMFILPIPPLSLQENYCDKIRVLEKQKELISKSITDVQQLFDYTMDKYFN
jgi:type I restriction enzyme S subunit